MALFQKLQLFLRDKNKNVFERMTNLKDIK